MFWAACTACTAISIHAPREGSDLATWQDLMDLAPISIHAPREGSDHCGREVRPLAGLFLSTLPARGATVTRQACPAGPHHFYPRSPRGERLPTFQTVTDRWWISIHAPREGSDDRELQELEKRIAFLSTLPSRGATDHVYRFRGWQIISIHAPREGSDRAYEEAAVRRMHFYPRSPRGERREADRELGQAVAFLSTLPARGATAAVDLV